MAKTLRTNINFTLTGAYQNNTDALSNGVPAASINVPLATEMQTGTSDSQSDRAYHVRATVAATSADTYDLAGTLTDAFGDTLTFVEVTAIVVYNRATTTGLTISVGGGTNAFSSWLAAANDEVKCGPSGMVVVTSPVDGHTVTAGTGDILEIDNATASSIEYDLVVIGRSA